MQLFIKRGVVIATHTDDQAVDASAYGDGVRIVSVPDGTVLQRLGDPPHDGQFDTRPFAAPAVTPDMLKSYAANKRWRLETGGMTINGMRVPTDPASQAKITAAYILSQLPNAPPMQWKADNGSFVQLSPAQIQAMAIAVGHFVEAAFTRESEAIASINDGSATTLDHVDAIFNAA